MLLMATERRSTTANKSVGLTVRLCHKVSDLAANKMTAQNLTASACSKPVELSRPPSGNYEKKPSFLPRLMTILGAIIPLVLS